MNAACRSRILTIVKVLQEQIRIIQRPTATWKDSMVRYLVELADAVPDPYPDEEMVLTPAEAKEEIDRILRYWNDSSDSTRASRIATLHAVYVLLFGAHVPETEESPSDSET